MTELNRGAKLAQDFDSLLQQYKNNADAFALAWKARVDLEEGAPLTPEEAEAFGLGMLGIILNNKTDVPLLA